MSSLRNAVARRPHKERSQPESRAKWGILEKHKDYSLRAKDYNLKKAKLAILSSKARERNPDEFAFGMLSAGTANQGKHGRGVETNRLSHDAVKLLKTQDAGYLRTVAGKGRRELEKLEQVVGMEGALWSEERKPMGRKVVFVDGEGGGREGMNGRKRKAAEMNGENGVDGLDTPTGTKEIDINNTEETEDRNHSSAATQVKLKTAWALQAAQQAQLDLRAARRRRKRLGQLRAAKLEALKKRQKEVMAAIEQLELQRAKMSRTVGGVNKDGVKWKIRERKR